MSETVGQDGGPAALRRQGIGDILTMAFQLYRRYWRTLLAVAAVVAIPLTLLQYLIGHGVRSHGQQMQDQVVVSTSFWAAASASLLAALVGLLLYQVLTEQSPGRSPRKSPGRTSTSSRATASASPGSAQSWS